MNGATEKQNLSGFGKSVSELPQNASPYNLQPEKRTEEEKLLARCKERCLYLIGNAEKTEAQLRRKLKASGKYPEEIIEKSLAFLKEYGYLNDLEFARHYVSFYGQSKSKKELEQKLYEKGVGREEIRCCLSELEEEAELTAAKKLLAKKCPDPSSLDADARRKLYAAMMRKGFSYRIVNQLLSVDESF